MSLIFLFIESNGNGSLTITDGNYQEAIEHMTDLGLNPNDWSCEDENGYDDDESMIDESDVNES